MAVDNWTINLECDGAPEGERHVQTEMDRDVICYWNLIDLIKDHGYSSVDYLYYKRKDSLVVLEQDPEVMKMLNECESKKMVSLFVTKDRPATLAPTKSNKEPSKSKPKKTKGRGGTKKKKALNLMHTEALYANEVEQRDDENQNTSADGDKEPKKRKGTILTHVWDLLDGDRIVVRCNKLGQPIGKEGGLLGQFLGTIARNGGYCPVGAIDWRKVKKDYGETIIQFVQTKFLYPHSCEKWIFKSIGRDWRKYKATLKKTLFNPKKKRFVLNKRCPDDIVEAEWKALVGYWKSEEGKTLSEKNKISREMRKTTHTKRYKELCSLVEDMVQLENLLDTQPELAQNSEGGVAWEGDALHQVLGEEKAGQVHGMGLLPVPKQVYGRKTHHFKDINIVSLDGSSSDVEVHMLEEIRQLKEHSRMQDKVIEELKNNQRHNENQEATMGNCARSDHNNSQNQVLNCKRKRVQCGAPNQNEGFLKHRDELNKETCEFEFSDDDNVLLSGEKFDSCQRSSATSRIIPKKQKVGSTVLLMTSKYPNNGNVAYATLLRTNPEALVGGVKIGSQFYKVRINHPITKDEPLVRPMLGCDNIGDAHAKGVQIAWPSMFVQMING
ncbi:unnamed protein product [Miscanthus lutarioriparius]|uniref:Transposase Tnp1/En/Spm-like domain-containing protein n=1 Tax=Miscanthus lutarioriparius TaxID=422564 RepID=A0A811QFV4_9POAL|nr:unnamed protein product [Miscanthus lutarioriparius]